MNGLLVFFHCPSNTGYAIDSYDRSFSAMSSDLMGSSSRVHFSYTSLRGGRPAALPKEFDNILEFDPASRDPESLRRIGEYIRGHGISLAFGVDQPVSRKCFRVMRKSGIRRMISYWGAPMSSLSSGIRLMLKRLEVQMNRDGPDHYIFESRAMARFATHGRGIPARRCSVVYPGLDPETFRPSLRREGYLEQEFGIPRERKIFAFAGHMEERKGVKVIIAAARELVEVRNRRDVHFLLLGNRDGEEEPFLASLGDGLSRSHVTFGGYRTDMPLIFPNCHAGVIASTGWDSFPASALEMASSGLPLLVSELQGLIETVESGRTGFTFPPGDEKALADLAELLLDDETRRSEMAAGARQRILSHFTTRRQVEELARVSRGVFRG